MSEIERIKGVAYIIAEGDWKEPVASVVFDDTNATIRALWVTPERRRLGYASSLIKAILADIKNGLYPQVKGMEIHYFCHPENEASNNLARFWGFTPWHLWFKKEADL